MTKLSEKEILKIIANCVEPKRSAQKALYDLLFDHIVFHTGRFNLSNQEQEDQIQESFIKIFCNIKKFDPKKSSIFTWTAVLAKNVCLNFISKKRLEFTTIEHIVQEVKIEDVHSDYLELALISDMIKALPEMVQKVFNLSIIQGLEHKDIAKLLDIKTNVSRAYLSRAKAILKDEISNQNEISLKHLNLKTIGNG